MKTVYLHGKLGKRFGRKWDLNVSSPLEAFSALEANSEGFLSYLAKTEKNGVRYIVLNKPPQEVCSQEDFRDSYFSEKTIQFSSKRKEIHIVPCVEGNVTVFTAIGILSTAGTLTVFGKIVVGIAVSFVVGAIMKALFKPPTRKEPTTTKSYLLNGAQNRQSQGVSVPLGYGRLRIGATNVSQAKISKHLTKSTTEGALESFTELEFVDLLSEGPIEGFANQNGALLPVNKNPDLIKQGIFLNNVPVENTPLEANQEPTLNYILNEDGELPDFQDGAEGSSKVLSKSVSFVIDHNLVLHGAGPYTEIGNQPRDTTNQYRPTAKGAIENGAKIASHFVANKNISKIVPEFNSNLYIQNDDGSTSGNTVRFAILIERDHKEYNILDPQSGCTVSLDRTKGKLKKEVAGNNIDAHFSLSGIATAVYAFDMDISFSRPKISSKGITFKFIKMSDEYDPSVKGGAAGGIGRSRELKLTSVSEIIEEPFLYPHSAMCKIKFDSKNFSSLPERAYHVKLKKVLIPSNYDPASRKYNGPWDGLFKGQVDSGFSVHSVSDVNKFWTDNPAWVFYDLLYNARYGVGRYGLEEQDIDRWQLYKISKYCDELVNTEYPIETSSSLGRAFSTLNLTSNQSENSYGQFSITIDNNQLRSETGGLSSYSESLFEKEFGSGDSFKGKKIAFFIASQTKKMSTISSQSDRDLEISSLKQKSSKQLGEILIEERVIIRSTPNSSGGGTVIVSGPSFSELSPSFIDGAYTITVGACASQINHPIVEPRFTCNAYITDKMEALSLINNMASIFRGIVSYSSGKIFALQDSLKNPIQLFNNSNVSPEGFSYSGGSKSQKISTSIVRFNDKDNSFKPGIVYEEDFDAIQKTGFKEKETLGFGVTSASQARRLAKWILFTSQLESEAVSFKTGQEASYLYPGAIFEVSDEMRVGKSKSGRVLDVSFYQKIYETTTVGGVRSIVSESQSYDPYILLDKHMFDEPFLGSVELTVCAGLSSSTDEKLNLRAPFERSVYDQDAEIESIRSAQILKFTAQINYNALVKKIGPSGQNVIATDLLVRIPFELSLGDNLFKVINHGFNNGDRVRFVTEGRLPQGLSLDRKGANAYYIIESTKHTFKVSVSGSGEQNVTNNGFDFLGNPGGLHYICPEDPQKTEVYLKQISVGSIWSAKGLMNAKNDEELEQVVVQKIDAQAVDIGDYWYKSSWLGYIFDLKSNDWVFTQLLGWVYLGQLKYPTADNGFWMYSSDRQGGSSSGWIWTNDSLKNRYWFFYSLHQDDDSSTSWVTPLYSDNGGLVEFFVYSNSNAGKNVGDNYRLNNRVYSIVELAVGGFFIGTRGANKISNSIHNISTSTPTSLEGKTFSERRKDLIDSGYYKFADIINIEALAENESVQRQNSIKITLDSAHNLSIDDSLQVFIEEVSSSDTFDDNINVVYVYDAVYKKWTTTVKPWVLVKINDFEFELENSSSLYSLFNSGNISNFGKLNFIENPQSVAERALEGQLFRTMTVKEDKNNTYNVVGLEYNSSKFDAIDKKTIVRRPIFPIPPQADMTIPEPPDSLILTDLTR